jgi:hypothetical protein
MIVALQHIRPTVLRGLAVALGMSFVLLAVGIRLLHEWGPGESPLILLVPFTMGAYLLLSGTFLRSGALKLAISLFFLLSVPGVAAVLWAGCALRIFSDAFCA